MEFSILQRTNDSKKFKLIRSFLKNIVHPFAFVLKRENFVSRELVLFEGEFHITGQSENCFSSFSFENCKNSNVKKKEFFFTTECLLSFSKMKSSY